MPQVEIADRMVEVDDEGFMTNPQQWNEDIARAIAAELGITLTDRHFVVLNYMRKEFELHEAAPSLRKLKNESGVGTKELYQLFPKGPAKKAARIAGLGKPQGCI